MRKNKALLHAPIIEEDISVPSKGWAEMIRKVYETDPLQCPQCGGPMHLVAFIEDHKVIDKFIRCSPTASAFYGWPGALRRLQTL